jgi:hypothetical protein
VIREFVARNVLRLEPVREIIGRYASQVAALWRPRISIDRTRTDYKFWDSLRRGKAKGYELGGLFAQPIVETIASWVLGQGFTATLNTPHQSEGVAYTNNVLSRLVAAEIANMTLLYEDHLGLGDQYIIVNPDGVLTIPSPEQVTMLEDDHGQLTGYRFETKLEKVTILDEYRMDGRTLTLKRAGQRDEVLQYANLIGRLPVIHFANDKGRNEKYGRPIYEGLLRLFRRYDDLLEKGLDGVEIMGNPIPVFEGLEDIDETIDANATAEDETYTDTEGNSETRKVIRFDRLAALFLGKGGSFKFAGPTPGFTEDLKNTLKLLFLLMLDKTHIPEFIWGNAIASSKASAETQMTPFVMFITGRRQRLEGEGADDLLGREARGGLLELFDVWLRMRRLTDPRIVVAPVQITWPALVEEDQTQKLARLAFAKQHSLITDETTLTQLDLVDDPAGEVGDAQEEARERRDEFERRLDKESSDEVSRAREERQQRERSPTARIA